MKSIQVDININYSVSRLEPELYWWQDITKSILLKALDAQDRLHSDSLQRVSLSLYLVREREIQSLNHSHRGKNKITDVLSFPEHELALSNNFRVKELDLGNMFICITRMKEQALEYGHSLEREGAFLFVHGALHLLGYDHQTADQEIEMNALQERVLLNVDLGR